MVNNGGGGNTIGGRKIVPLTTLKPVDKKSCEYYALHQMITTIPIMTVHI